ncbi:MAG: MarR family winged helix-turn-helix transcriptional regulator [Bradymonadia bacterium]
MQRTDNDMASDPLHLDQQLCFALYAASRAMTQAYRPGLDALGLTYPQYLVMLVLWEADDISLKDLGGRLMLDSGTLTPLVRRLEAQRLLRRVKDPEDERRIRIRLTTQGQALRARAGEVQGAVLCKMTDPLDLEGLVGLREQIKTLTCMLRGETSGDTENP